VDEALSHLAPLAIEQRDQVQARLMLVERLALSREAGGGLGQASLLEAFASLALAQGRADGACRLLGAAEAVRDAYGAMVGTREHAEHERLVTALRRELDDARFSTAWDEGRAMITEQALEYALQVTA
jgi:hypothetical protein